jgi:hypothetical protein
MRGGRYSTHCSRSLTTANGRFLPVKATQCAGQIRLQTTGQVECKWVVKSMQLRTIEIGEVLAQVAQIKTSITAAQKVSDWNVIFKVERVKQSLLPTR